MPDTPVDPALVPPHDPSLEARVTQVEGDVRDIRSILGQMMPMLIRIDATLTATLPHLATKADVETLRSEMRSEIAKVNSEIAKTNGAISELRGEMHSEIGRTNNEIGGLRGEMHSELGKLRADLADKPGKAYLWGILATLIATYAAGLAGLALLHH